MKKECEIIQDLLFSYADNVLHHASKEMVDKHLKDCEECRKQLEEIQKEEKQETQTIRKEIAYLKQVERKARWKVIKMVIGVLLFIGVITALVYYGNRFIIFHNIAKVYEDCQQADSYYFVTTKEVQLEDVTEKQIIKEWYENGKGKIQTEIQTRDGRQILLREYIDYQAETSLLINEASKEYVQREMQWGRQRRAGVNLDTLVGWKNQLKATFTYKIGEVKSRNGNFYVIIDGYQEHWFNAATLLYEKYVDKEAVVSANMDGIMNIEKDDDVQYYKLYVCDVEDAELEIPDLTGYKEEEPRVG